MRMDRRVVLVTGKGGTGKTTVSTAIALAAAARGKRVLLVETSGATRVPAIFRVPPKGYAIQALAPNLSAMSVTPMEAIEEYVVRELHFRRLYRMAFRNRVMAPFVDAVPGLHDLIQLGKVFDLEREMDGPRRRWDLIVVDAPATGHGLTMLGSPRAMMDLTVSGPIHDNARDVAALYEDPTRCALVLVALPEEMPVNETLELHERLGPLAPLVSTVVLNEMHPAPDAAEWTRLRPSLEPDIGGRAVIGLVDAAIARSRRQSTARERLATIGAPVVELPFLFHRDLGRTDLQPFVEAFS